MPKAVREFGCSSPRGSGRCEGLSQINHTSFGGTPPICDHVVCMCVHMQYSRSDGGVPDVMKARTWCDNCKPTKLVLMTV